MGIKKFHGTQLIKERLYFTVKIVSVKAPRFFGFILRKVFRM